MEELRRVHVRLTRAADVYKEATARAYDAFVDAAVMVTTMVVGLGGGGILIGVARETAARIGTKILLKDDYSAEEFIADIRDGAIDLATGSVMKVGWEPLAKGIAGKMPKSWAKSWKGQVANEAGRRGGLGGEHRGRRCPRSGPQGRGRLRGGGLGRAVAGAPATPRYGRGTTPTERRGRRSGAQRGKARLPPSRRRRARRAAGRTPPRRPTAPPRSSRGSWRRRARRRPMRSRSCGWPWRSRPSRRQWQGGGVAGRRARPRAGRRSARPPRHRPTKPRRETSAARPRAKPRSCARTRRRTSARGRSPATSRRCSTTGAPGRPLSARHTSRRSSASSSPGPGWTIPSA